MAQPVSQREMAGAGCDRGVGGGIGSGAIQYEYCAATMTHLLLHN